MTISFILINEIGKEDQEWTQYNVIAKAPEADVAGVSMRARFTSFPTGKDGMMTFRLRRLR